jgi:hypothetical protein
MEALQEFERFVKKITIGCTACAREDKTACETV